MQRILFICTGNICRSATAEGILQHFVNEMGQADLYKIESAGLHDYHQGEAPDHRAVDIASKNGIDLSYIRSRKIDRNDFYNFDFIFAMDAGHYRQLQQICPADAACEIKMFIEGMDVPDPWYGSIKDFEIVYDLVLKGSKDLLNQFN